ncbi:hypothetical protein K8S19_00080 [bacterium]|nr:hypothetical protein [bacterium]
MSKAISLKVNESIFHEIEMLRKESHLKRNTYINMALDYYNHLMRRRVLKGQLAAESALVSEESMQVNRELAELDDGLN